MTYEPDPCVYRSVPSHIVSICDYVSSIFLDTQLGIIYFTECPNEIALDPNLPFKPISDQIDEYFPADERD